MADWFDDDDFWSTFASRMFTDARLDRTPQEVDQIEQLLQLAPGDPVLDLCCGPGRHSVELAARGHSVTGVDRTSAYLVRARAAAAQRQVEVEWVQQDMRRFARPNAFAGAISMFTSFGYFSDRCDDLQVAKNLCTSLRPGGRALIDVMGKEVIAGKFSERDWYRGDDDAIHLEERRILDSWRRIENTWHLFRDGQHASHTFTLRLFSGEELDDLLREAGFARIDLYGGLDGRPYDHEAARLVAIAQK